MFSRFWWTDFDYQYIDMLPLKDVPFWDCNKTASHLGGQIPPKNPF